MSLSISESFTAAGTTDRAAVRSGVFDISGTFVATVELQRIINGEAQALVEYTDGGTIVGDDVSFDNGVTVPMQFECTSYTSGTVQVRLVGEKSGN